MNDPKPSPIAGFLDYSQRLQSVLQRTDWSGVSGLAAELLDCWRAGRHVFICGNGGSAANAIHLANDLLYGVSKTPGSGLRATALSANSSVLTCLANDKGYDEIFSMQLSVQGSHGDVLIVLSGSGNSPNIIRALDEAKKLGMRSYAIVGYTGGKAKAMADVAIHTAVDDMQVSEDMQLVVGHMIMQWLYQNRPVGNQ
jgi:D-sedoheptulose 7-phosphate isomerase